MHEASLVSVTFGAARLVADERRRALAVLSSRELERFRAEPPVRGEAFLAGRLLLRRLAGAALGIDPAAVPLIATCPDCDREHGRPVIAGTEWSVSLSHGVDAVVAVLALGMRVGIDLEHPATAVDDLAPLIPNPTLERWTRIEAVLKADGRGLRVDPATVEFEAVEFEVAPGGELASVPGSPIRYLVHEVDVAPGLRASLSTERR